MIIVLARALILYALIIFSLRLMGKRQIGELQPSELVITILVSNIATLPIEDTSIPLLAGIIPILTLVCLDVIMSGISLKSRRIRTMISGNPKVIIRDGELDQNQMQILRYSIDDLMESLHDYGIFDIREVQFAIVETTGKISVYQKHKYQAATNESVKFKGENLNPPVIVINDGVFIEDAIAEINLTKQWLDSFLKSRNLVIKDVFLLSMSSESDFNIIEKEKKKAK